MPVTIDSYTVWVLGNFGVVFAAMIAFLGGVLRGWVDTRLARSAFRRSYLLEELKPLLSYLNTRTLALQPLRQHFEKPDSDTLPKEVARLATASMDDSLGRFVTTLSRNKSASKILITFMDADQILQKRLDMWVAGVPEHGGDVEKQLETYTRIVQADCLFLRSAVEDYIFEA